MPTCYTHRCWPAALKSFNKVAIAAFNRSVDARVPFDPTVKDGKGTIGLPLPKSNWTLPSTRRRSRPNPVTGGITFNYGGVEVSRRGGVMHENGHEIPGLFARRDGRGRVLRWLGDDCSPRTDPGERDYRTMLAP
jgi:hypothetical protein